MPKRAPPARKRTAGTPLRARYEQRAEHLAPFVVRPADWTRHRHRDDPRYARVRVHVTYLPDRTRCAACPLPALLREYRAG